MGVLKTITKEKIRFLMGFDYNNVLGRLKFVLGKDAYFFSDIRVRQNDVKWSTNANASLKPLMEASEVEKKNIKQFVDDKIVTFNQIIEKDSLIGDYAKQITTYPSEEFVYYTEVNGKYQIVLTGWGCLEAAKEGSEINVYKSAETLQKTNKTIHPDLLTKKDENAKNISSTTRFASKQEIKTRPEGFFINDNKTKALNKKENNHTKIEVFKSIILVLLAAFIALMIPVILTGAVNRLVADITGQWYLNGLSRVLITVFVAIITYSLAYILIRFTTLRKSIVFNIVCFILTFIWSIFMGIAWIPD